MWNDDDAYGDLPCHPRESKITLQSADEVALWAYLVAVFSSPFRDDPIVWPGRRDFAIRQADDCVLAYRERMTQALPGKPAEPWKQVASDFIEQRKAS